MFERIFEIGTQTDIGERRTTENEKSGGARLKMGVLCVRKNRVILKMDGFNRRDRRTD